MRKRRRKSEWTIFCIVLIIFLLILVGGRLGWGGELLKSELASCFSTDLGGYQLTFAKVITAIAALCCTFLICSLIQVLIRLLSKSDRAKTVGTLLSSIVTWIGVIAGIVWALSVLGLNATAVFASIGIVALIVGFGAQSLIEDVISGLFIVLEGQYNVGDIIVLDDFRGTVERIGMRTTSVIDAGGNYKIVNNSDIRNIQNRSRAISVAVVEMGIEYEEDLLRVEAVCEKAFPSIFEKHKDIFLDIPAYLGMADTGDSAVILKYRVKCTESDVFSAERILRRELYLLFGENHINIPYSQVVLHQSVK